MPGLITSTLGVATGARLVWNSLRPCAKMGTVSLLDNHHHLSEPLLNKLECPFFCSFFVVFDIKSEIVPFTPYHFGPGLAVKAVAPRHFSFSVFVFSQVLTDIEPLYYMLSGQAPIHRFFHTYAGATFVAAVSYLIGRPLCGFCRALVRHTFGWRLADLRESVRLISPTAALSAAFIGSYSHVALDSIMHHDTHPLAPFSNANPLYGMISVSDLHLYCLVAGVVGLLGLSLWRLGDHGRNQ